MSTYTALMILFLFFFTLSIHRTKIFSFKIQFFETVWAHGFRVSAIDKLKMPNEIETCTKASEHQRIYLCTACQNPPEEKRSFVGSFNCFEICVLLVVDVFVFWLVLCIWVERARSVFLFVGTSSVIIMKYQYSGKAAAVCQLEWNKKKNKTRAQPYDSPDRFVSRSVQNRALR